MDHLTPRRKVLIVLGAMLGLSCGWGPVFLGVVPVFLKPMAASFSWSRAEVSLLPILGMIGIAIGASVISRIANRMGWQKVIAFSIVLLSLGMLAIAATPASLAYVAILGMTIGIVGAATSFPGYVAIISLAFDRQLGIALGFAMLGGGVGAMFMPIIAASLLEVMDWRAACACFFAICLVPGLIAHQIIFRAWTAGRAISAAGSATAAKAATAAPSVFAGVSLAEALKGYRLWLFCVVSILFTGAVAGPVVHLAAYASDRGFSAAIAAQFVGWLGLGVALARVGSGFVLDRIFAPLVACAAFLVGGAGLYMLTADALQSEWSMALGSSLVGLAGGANGVMAPFIVRKYFGVRAFGSIYGLVFSTSLLAGALGTYLYGWSYDLLKSYIPILGSSAIVCCVCSLAVLSLGRYRY